MNRQNAERLPVTEDFEPRHDPTWTIWGEPESDPWDGRYQGNIEIGEASGFRIATVWNTPRGDVKQVAALILAAPKMLVACKTMLDFLDAHSFTGHEREILSAVIARAEGTT